jgi:Rieske Fe-S protein
VSPQPLTSRPLTRRAVVAGACGTACAVAVGACSGYGPARPPAAGDAAAAEPGGALAAADDIPVGGGTVFGDRNVVVTQPVAGEFRAFSATCTHRGCTVTAVEDGRITCPCHGSAFAIADGSVVDGPAPSPLPEQAVTVVDGSISLA